MMRAVLLASATAASLGGLRLTSATSHGEGRPRPLRTCWITEVAPATNTLRKASSPAFVIAPSRPLPAVECSFGVIPSQAEKSRPDRKAGGLPTFITESVAAIGPTEGISANRRLSSLPRCQAISLASILRSSGLSRTYSLPSVANKSLASGGKFSSPAMRISSGSGLSVPLAAPSPNPSPLPTEPLLQWGRRPTNQSRPPTHPAAAPSCAAPAARPHSHHAAEKHSWTCPLQCG